MLNPHGYAVVISPDGNQPWDVFSCAHCGTKVHVPPFTNPEDLGGRCTLCEDGHGRGLICKNPECHKECRPFIKKIEAMEAEARRLRGWA